MCNFPVLLSKDEVYLEEAQLDLQAMTPPQREGGSSDMEDDMRSRAWALLDEMLIGSVVFFKSVCKLDFKLCDFRLTQCILDIIDTYKKALCTSVSRDR